MNDEAIMALIQLAPSITTSSVLIMAWMLERRRADRLESIALNRQAKQDTIDLLQQKDEV